MREAIGGSWLLGFVVLFIVLFSSYLAISINYTKAFKVKNRIINIIEESEGFSTSPSSVTTKSDNTLKNSKITEDKVYYYLKDIGYTTTKIDDAKCPSGDLYTGGYCVDKIKSDQGSYYKVTTFIKIEIPLINSAFTIPISGETKVLFNTQD